MKNKGLILLSNNDKTFTHSKASGYKENLDIEKKRNFSQNISVLFESLYYSEISAYRVNYYLENKWICPLVVSLVKKIAIDSPQEEWITQEYIVPARNKVLVSSRVLSLESYINNDSCLFIKEVRCSKLLETI